MHYVTRKGKCLLLHLENLFALSAEGKKKPKEESYSVLRDCFDKYYKAELECKDKDKRGF
jgi:hypothetical protein